MDESKCVHCNLCFKKGNKGIQRKSLKVFVKSKNVTVLQAIAVKFPESSFEYDKNAFLCQDCFALACKMFNSFNTGNQKILEALAFKDEFRRKAANPKSFKSETCATKKVYP